MRSRTFAAGEIERASIPARVDASLDARWQALNAQKALGVGLVVAAAPLHAGDALVIQAVGAAAARHDDVALVEFERNFAIDRLLSFSNERQQGIHFRGVPETVV